MKNLTKVYELIDNTSEEVYFSLGIFTDVFSLIKSLESWDDDVSISPYTFDGYEVIEIKERTIGWDEGGRLVYTIRRKMVYNDNGDDFWRMVEVDNRLKYK